MKKQSTAAPTAPAAAPTAFPEVFDDVKFAQRLGVSPRWVQEHSRDPRDPLPHFKRGRVRLYQFNAAFAAWWQRHTVGATA